MSLLQVAQSWGLLRYSSARHALVCGAIGVLLAVAIDLGPFRDLSATLRFAYVPACLLWLWVSPPCGSLWSNQ